MSELVLSFPRAGIPVLIASLLTTWLLIKDYLACERSLISVEAILAGLFWGLSMWIGIKHYKIRKAQQAWNNSTLKAFQNVRHRLQTMNQYLENIESLANAERREPPSERQAQRLKLLDTAMQTWRNRADGLRTELWARDVQLWLNRLEGFLSETLLSINPHNGPAIRAALRVLINAVKSLLAKGGPPANSSELGQQAHRLLSECLDMAPEFEGRVKDAHVLASIGGQTHLPEELSPGTTWLHWLQNAIPTLDLLPEVLTVDEEKHRMNAEIRLLQDSLPSPIPPRSLDPPEAVPTVSRALE